MNFACFCRFPVSSETRSYCILSSVVTQGGAALSGTRVIRLTSATAVLPPWLREPCSGLQSWFLCDVSTNENVVDILVGYPKFLSNLKSEHVQMAISHPMKRYEKALPLPPG